MIHEANEGVWGVSESLGAAHAWIQLGSPSEVTQTPQERWFLWEQAANSSTRCDMGNCRAYTLLQGQYQKNFCFKDSHHSKCLGSFPSPGGGVCAARAPMPTWSQGCVLLVGAGRGQILSNLSIISLIASHVTWKFHLSSQEVTSTAVHQPEDTQTSLLSLYKFNGTSADVLSTYSCHIYIKMCNGVLGFWWFFSLFSFVKCLFTVFKLCAFLRLVSIHSIYFCILSGSGKSI